MISQAMQDAIRHVVDTADFAPVFEYFADDIEFRVSMGVPSSAFYERRGKHAVIRQLEQGDQADSPAVDEPLFANGERIVAFRSESFPLGCGLTIRAECAFVFDVRDGLITRLAMNHEVSAVMEANASHAPLARDRDVGRSEPTLSATIEI